MLREDERPRAPRHPDAGIAHPGRRPVLDRRSVEHEAIHAVPVDV